MLVVCLAAAAAILLTANAQNIVRNACQTEATFYKIASGHAMMDAKSFLFESNAGITGCIDGCIENNTCHAFNTKKLQDGWAMCELLPTDRNAKPNDIVAKVGWDYYDTGLYASKVGQFCSSHTYNPCYPCRCFDSCPSSIGYTCNCTAGMPKLPQIYMAFDKIVGDNPKRVKYNRGKDMEGKTNIWLKKDAFIGDSSGQPGKVLYLYGTNAAASAGNFDGHPLNNPGNAQFTISLWVKIVTEQAGYQTLLTTGKLGNTIGVLIRVHGKGTKLVARVILWNCYLVVDENIKDSIIGTFGHIALVYKYENPTYLILYLNGKEVARDTSFGYTTTSVNGNSNLRFGAGGPFPLDDKFFYILIADFAYFDYPMTPAEVSFLQTKGNV